MRMNPTVSRWALAEELRKLRGERTATELAKAIRVSTTTVTRWEEIDSAVPREKDLEELLRYYELDQAEVDRLLQLRREASKRSSWQSYDIVRSYQTYLGLEEAATKTELFQDRLVPGLLQTPEYTRAILESNYLCFTEAEVNERLKLRTDRQNSWFAGDAELWVIVAEEALHRHVGGREVMQVQLAHLCDLAEHPRITLQLVPHSKGEHVALESGSFVKLHLDGMSIVYVESLTRSLFLNSPADLETYRLMFNHLRAVAASTKESKTFLKRLATNL